MEVCFNYCAVVLDTRWEQINRLDDIKHAPSTRQLDNGEDRLEGRQEQLTEQWTGQSTRTLLTGEWRGWI